MQAGHTGVCLNVNPARPGAAYGYVDMGGWIGGQAEYVMVPYADFNLLKVHTGCCVPMYVMCFELPCLC